MKKTLLLILGLGAITAFFVYFLNSREKAPKPPQRKEAPASVPVEPPVAEEMKALQWKGTVLPEKVTDVVFKVSGTLENGEASFKKGDRFRKNQLLFQVNNRDAFLQMLEDKTALQQKVEAMLPQLEASGREKWTVFLASLGPASLVSDLPSVQSAEEQKLIASRGIAVAYQQIKAQEKGMAGYFYIAPFDGVIYERSARTGEKIRKNQVIAQIGKPGKMLVKCTVIDFSLEIGRVEIMDLDHVFRAQGRFLKSVQDPLDKHLWDVYFLIEDSKDLKADEKVIVSLQLK